jgi:hypothetical protein
LMFTWIFSETLPTSGLPVSSMKGFGLPELNDSSIPKRMSMAPNGIETMINTIRPAVPIRLMTNISSA